MRSRVKHKEAGYKNILLLVASRILQTWIIITITPHFGSDGHGGRIGSVGRWVQKMKMKITKFCQ